MVPSSDYLGAVRSLCTERNALLMLDEVQTGLGRTGHWFAFQSQGLEPDVVTMAKALGNGMPVGACWARAEVAAAFGPGDHGSTFGGQPLALAAVQATLAVMEAEDVCRPGPRGRGTAGRGAGAAARCGLGARRGPAPGGAAGGPGGQGGLGAGARAGPPGQPGAPRRHPCGAAAARGRRGARRRPADPRRRPGRDRRRSRRLEQREPPTHAQPLRHRRPRPRFVGTRCSRSRWTTHRDRVLEGQGVALLFEKPSARTRNSTEMAVVDLGGHPVYIQGAEVGLDVRETAEDVARTLACYHRVLCAAGLRPRRPGAHGGRAGAQRVRHPGREPALRHRAPLPGGGRRAHAARGARHAAWPRAGLCRGRQQRGPLPGQGRPARGHGRPHRLPGGLLPPGRRAGGVAGVRRPRRARRDGPAHRRPPSGRQGCRRALHRRLDEHGPGRGAGGPPGRPSPASPSTTQLVDLAAADAVVLHCLPAHRGEEITDAVLEGPRSVVWRQAAHRRTAMRGILAWATGGTP